MLARGLKARSMMATMGERGKEHNRLSGLEDADDATTAAAATEIPNPSLLFHFSSLVPSLTRSYLTGLGTRTGLPLESHMQLARLSVVVLPSM